MATAMAGRHFRHQPVAKWKAIAKRCHPRWIHCHRRVWKVWSRVSSALSRLPSKACCPRAFEWDERPRYHRKVLNNSPHRTASNTHLPQMAANSCLPRRVSSNCHYPRDGNNCCHLRAASSCRCSKVWSNCCSRRMGARNCHCWGGTLLPRLSLHLHHRGHHHGPAAWRCRRQLPGPPPRPPVWSVLSAWLQSPFAFITSMRSTLGWGSPFSVRFPDSQAKRLSLSFVIVFSALVLPPSGFTPVS